MSPGLAKRVTTSPQAESPLPQTPSALHVDAGVSTVNVAATNLKIQNALDRNMQKLNLARQTNIINSKLKSANLTKEEIELFTNTISQQNSHFGNELAPDGHYTTPFYNANTLNDESLSSSSSSSSNAKTIMPGAAASPFQRSSNHALNHLLAQQQQFNLSQQQQLQLQLLQQQQQQHYLQHNHLIPDANSYFLNRLPNSNLMMPSSSSSSSMVPSMNAHASPPSQSSQHFNNFSQSNLPSSVKKTNATSNNGMLMKQSAGLLNSNPLINTVIMRNSAEREMTPDSIDNESENCKHELLFFFHLISLISYRKTSFLIQDTKSKK